MDQLTRMAELAEAEFMAQIGTRPGGPLGIALRRFGEGGTGTALSVRMDPTSYWNKIVGFTEVTGDLIDSLLDFYRIEGSPLAVLQIAPEILPEDWPEICAKHGLERGGTIAKVGAPISEVHTTAETDLRITELTPDDKAHWLGLVPEVFGMITVPQIFEIAFDSPKYRHFGAWDGTTLVGSATLVPMGDVGHLGIGAVHPDYRNRGGQSALIARRLAEAKAAGSRFVTSEAGFPAEEGTNPSLNNLLRAGFRLLYPRPNWIWRP